jgi:hypothetical protein
MKVLIGLLVVAGLVGCAEPQAPCECPKKKIRCIPSMAFEEFTPPKSKKTVILPRWTKECLCTFPQCEVPPQKDVQKSTIKPREVVPQEDGGVKEDAAPKNKVSRDPRYMA